jgi:hypothetical protein
MSSLIVTALGQAGLTTWGVTFQKAHSSDLTSRGLWRETWHIWLWLTAHVTSVNNNELKLKTLTSVPSDYTGSKEMSEGTEVCNKRLFQNLSDIDLH